MLPERPEADAEPRPDRRRHRGARDTGLLSGNTTRSHIGTDFRVDISGPGTPDRYISVFEPQEQERIRTDTREGRGEMNVGTFLEPFE